MEQKNFSLLTARAVIPQKKSEKYSRILGGFPDSVFMKSGLVTLKPGKTWELTVRVRERSF